MNIRDKIKGKTPLMYSTFTEVTFLKIIDKDVQSLVYNTQYYNCRKFYKYISIFSI